MRQVCLMLGAGHSVSARKLVAPTSVSEEMTTWVRLDMNPDCKPDILFDLNDVERGKKLPVADNTFDEIHAYEVLEHFGRQGDFKGFFTGMRELWRVLKPGGYLIGTCPSWDAFWAWGDPGHTRIVSEGTLSYLTKELYLTVGHGPATDYKRFVEPCWWEGVQGTHNKDTGGFIFAMRKIV